MPHTHPKRGFTVILLIMGGLILLLFGFIVLQFSQVTHVSALFDPFTPTSTFALYDPLNPGTQSPTPFQPLPTATNTATATATATQTPKPTKTPQPTNTPQPPSPTSLPYHPGDDLPASATILGLVGYPQQHNLSCEARSAVDWARYYGVQISESDFQALLPLSSNPDRGFVGYVDDPAGHIPPASYGVHAVPVAKILRNLGLNATAHKGYTYDQLRAQIAAGNPVIVWIIGNTWSGVPISYTPPDGMTTTVAHYEHTAILKAYDEYGVTLVDNNQVYWRSLSGFLSSWSVLGNMAITAE